MDALYRINSIHNVATYYNAGTRIIKLVIDDNKKIYEIVYVEIKPLQTTMHYYTKNIINGQ